MICVAAGILLLAALGVTCGIASLLDTFGVIDLDAPEYKHIGEELDDEEL